MIKELDRLEAKIQQLKTELIQTVERTGINSTDTLSCSQKLDHLIFIYQKYLRQVMND